MGENPIKYSDLISPDDSISKLIDQLTQLQSTYTTMADTIKKQAEELVANLKKVSGATTEGKNATKEASDDATRLEKAWKRLEQAMSENAKEITRLNAARQQMNRYNKAMVELGKQEIKTHDDIAKASYNQLSAQYALNKAYINQLSVTDRQTEANRKLIATTKEIYEQMKKLQADTGKMQLNVGNYPQNGESSLVSSLKGLASFSSQVDTKAIMSSLIGITSAAGAVTVAISALKGGVSTAMDYEHALSGLAAILSTTKDNITELSSQARDLGATTAFTAKEVVELQTELAKLGYTTKDITQMTPEVLSFAQATGSSLADAASLSGAALRMFEKDTSSTKDFVDKMTASTTKSALSFNYLNNALSTVAPVANAFGFKLEDVLALLGQLANAGFDASSAATATRNIFLNLADSSGKLAQALGKPVTTLDEMINGFKTLESRGIDLATALDLTDKRSVAAFETFLKGTDSVISLRDALTDCDGAAQDMAKTMGDDLAGDVKTLQSAWEDLMIEINNGQGIIRNAVQWLTSLVRSWKDYLSLPKSKDEVMNDVASAYDDGTYDDNGNIIKKNQSKPKLISKPGEAVRYADSQSGSKLDSQSGKNTKAQQREEERRRKAAEAAQKRTLKEQEQQQKQSLELSRKYEDALIELYEDEQTRERAKIVAHYDRLKENAVKYAHSLEEVAMLSLAYEQQKQVKLAELIQKGADKQKKIEEDKQKKLEQQRNQSMRTQQRIIEQEYQADLAGIDLLETSENKKTEMRLNAEKERLQKLLALYEKDGKILHDAEIKNITAQIAAIDNDLVKNRKNRDIYDILGFNLSDEKKQAISDAFGFAMDNLSSYLDAWVEAAEKKAELANQEVERTKSVLDAEIEARNKGYASNVAEAQKELDLARKTQQKALQEQQKAQKAQQALATIQQATNLVSASALIWSQLGFPWAIPAIAVMWGSFAAAKIKAAQVTSQGTEEYGEGTVELLQGGSHQSGRDVDLGTKPDGTRRRAEGGEFFAVINKRNSRRFRRVIPDVINSLNDGTFAQKYQHAYDDGGIALNLQSETPDLRDLSSDVRLIREQGEHTRMIDGNGNEVVRYKNLRRIIRRQ